MEFSGINTTQVLVTIISTIGAVICAYFGRKKEGTPAPEAGEKKVEKQPVSKWALGMWACILIAALNTGFLGWRLLSPAPTTDVAITYPANLARVDQTETVRGSVEGLPAERAIWVVVYVQQVGRYYPQNRPADLEANNKWSSIVYIGVPTDTGKRFDVLAVVAEPEAQNAFNAYLAEAADQSDWPGMEALPSGTVIYDRVTVTRK